MPGGAAAAWARQLADEGYVVIQQLLSADDVRTLTARLERPGAVRAGTRTVLNQPWCAGLGRRLRADPRLQGLLPHDARVVQCTLFDKSPGRNWLVALHQDLGIPVAERVDSPVCKAWVAKEGVLHVQPPAGVLEGLLAVRIHLDDCDAGNGALRVVPGSHRQGRLDRAQPCRQREQRGERLLQVPRGSALLMRALLLHSSSRAIRDAPRRVLHFLIGPERLPEGLRWPASAV
jgi:hypothetical protein